jgi:hypothetical protein
LVIGQAPAKKGESMEEAQAVFAAYMKLSSQGKRQFDALISAFRHGLQTRTQSEAGRKAAATKKDSKAKAASPGTEA